MNDTKRVLAALTVLGAVLTSSSGTADAATGPGAAGKQGRTVEADAGVFSSLPVVGVLVNPFGGQLFSLPLVHEVLDAGDGRLHSLPALLDELLIKDHATGRAPTGTRRR